ncbi:hypothetical protein LX36DRAFT_445719 [Colletotrichum falcatum]|nr:hypothetical protein LX36DRAFT_445719 [Colletotrichum falcatum]
MGARAGVSVVGLVVVCRLCLGLQFDNLPWKCPPVLLGQASSIAPGVEGMHLRPGHLLHLFTSLPGLSMHKALALGSTENGDARLIRKLCPTLSTAGACSTVLVAASAYCLPPPPLDNQLVQVVSQQLAPTASWQSHHTRHICLHTHTHTYTQLWLQDHVTT